VPHCASSFAAAADRCAGACTRARRYGNTSSASVWYALSYIEACQGVAAGDVVWQVGFGSGFKCNSAVWKARRSIRDNRHAAWAHMVNGNLECVWKYLEARAALTNPIPHPAFAGPAARAGCAGRCSSWEPGMRAPGGAEASWERCWALLEGASCAGQAGCVHAV